MAPLPLPGVQPGIWPTPSFLPTPQGAKSKTNLNKAMAKMNLDLAKDCTWTRKPGKERMPERPTFEMDHVPGCFQHCYATRQIG